MKRVVRILKPSLWMLGIGLSTLVSVQAEVLSYDDAVSKALEASYDIQIAAVDVEISKTDVRSAFSEYFPTLTGRANTEYLKDFDDDGGTRPVTSVGNTVIPSGTRYQNSVGVSLEQHLYDFGVRKRKLRMAKTDVQLQQTIAEQSIRDLKLKVLERYARSLATYKALKIREALLGFYQDIYKMNERLYEAGTQSKVEVAEQAIQVAEGLDTIAQLKQQLQNELTALSELTKQAYTASETQLSEVEEVDEDLLQVSFTAEKTPEYQEYELAILKKKAEVEMLRRKYLPELSLYSYYNIYGFDRDNWAAGVGDLRGRTVSMGLSMTMPIFDGFKTDASIDKAKLEMQRLGLERDRKIEELRKDFNTVKTDALLLSEQLAHRTDIVNQSGEKEQMVERLSDQQLVDKTAAIKERITLLTKQLDLDKTRIERAVSLKRLKILSEG